MLIPDLLDKKKLVEKIKENEQSLYPDTKLYAAETEVPPPYFPDTELHADTPLEYGGKLRMDIGRFMNPASYYVNRATDIIPELVVAGLKKMGLPITGNPAEDFGTFLVYALLPGSPDEFTGAASYAKAVLGDVAQKAGLTAKPAYAEEIELPDGRRMRLYHGTTSNFPDESINIEASRDKHYGFYTTSSKGAAQPYAKYLGDEGIKQYLLKKDAKILDVSDPYEFVNYLLKNGIIDEKKLNDESFMNNAINGFLWAYDVTNRTHYQDDAVRIAKELGYDVIMIPDYLPSNDPSQPTETYAYVIVNPEVLETGATDEAIQARWEQYRQELEAKKQEEIETPVLAFHGTTKAFDTFEVEKYDPNDIVLDRFIGSHFAVDPRLANNMTMDSTRTNTLEGANVHAVNLHIKKPYVLPQHLPGYKGIAFDQTAFNIDIARRVFPKRKDLFVEYWAKQRNMPKEEVSKIYDKIKAGKRITEKDSPLFYPTPDYDDQFAGLADNYGILGFDNDWKMEMVREYRKQLAEEGYDAIQYQNTSPMETKNVKNKTCYVVFDNSLIKNAYSEQDYGKQVDSINKVLQQRFKDSLGGEVPKTVGRTINDLKELNTTDELARYAGEEGRRLNFIYQGEKEGAVAPYKYYSMSSPYIDGVKETKIIRNPYLPDDADKISYDSNLIDNIPEVVPRWENILDKAKVKDPRYKKAQDMLGVTYENNINDGKTLWRGMSAGEFWDLIERGKQRSRGDYNLPHQESLTYFSGDSYVAFSYASGFSPWPYVPTYEEPAYVIRIKKPVGTRIIPNESGEYGLVGDYFMDDILEVYEVRLAVERPGMLVVHPYIHYDNKYDLCSKSGVFQEYVYRKIYSAEE